MSEAHGPPTTPTRPVPSDWTGGRIAALVVGIVLALVAVAFVGAGGTALWAAFQKDDGYVTTDVHEFSTSGAALATDPVDLGSAGVHWAYSSNLVDKIRIRVTPAGSGAPVFVGIGPSRAVDGYLAGVNHTVITDFWDETVDQVPGSTPASAPGKQTFWVAASTGPGTQTVQWNPSSGTWTAVVMNADGRPGLNVAADLGGTVPQLTWIILGTFLAGALFTAGAVFLIVRAVHRRPVQATAV
jgi:hypothetical protein